jgi:hypothetical protein
MVANSLAVAAGIRASSGRERPPMERTILARREYPFCWPCRELSHDHTPESFHRRSRLGEKIFRSATPCGVIPSSFRRGKAPKLEHRAALASLAVMVKVEEAIRPVPAGK